MARAIAVDAAGPGAESVPGHSDVFGAPGGIHRGAGTHSGRHSVGEAAREGQRKTAGELSAAGFSKPRVAPSADVYRFGNVRQCGDCGPTFLQRGELHGQRQLLRPDMPHGYAAGIHGVPELAAFAGGVRAVPYWAGRGMVCAQQAVGRAPGFRGHVSYVLEAYSYAGA